MHLSDAIFLVAQALNIALAGTALYRHLLHHRWEVEERKKQGEQHAEILSKLNGIEENGHD